LIFQHHRPEKAVELPKKDEPAAAICRLRVLSFEEAADLYS